MTLRITLALTLLGAAATPVVAQPAPRPAARRPAPSAAEDMAAFEKDLDTLFAKGGLTSDQAASRASGASLTVRRRAAEIEAALAQAQTAELARVPQLSGRLSYTRLSPLDPTPLQIGGMTFELGSAENAYLAEAQLTIPLSDYLVRFPKIIDAARLGVDAARLNKRASEIDAGQEARVAYYEWVRAKLQVLIAKRQLIQVQKTLGQIRALAEVQRLSRADLLRVESQEASAEQALNQLENFSALREEQLRVLIGAAPGEPIAIGEDIRADVTAPGPAQLDDMVTTATRQRLEFKAIDTGISATERQRDAEIANQLPRLSAFGVVDYANPNQRVFPQNDEFTATWSVGAQLTWTLNDALTAGASRRRLAAEANELRADRENLARGTRIELLAAQQAIAIARSALATSQKGLAASEEGYRVRKELLNAERATAVELVDAETELTRARIAALNARVDLRVARAQLDHAIGNDAK